MKYALQRKCKVIDVAAINSLNTKYDSSSQMSCQDKELMSHSCVKQF